MKTLKNSLVLAILFMTSIAFSQQKEMVFDIYTTSAAKATRTLLADQVALRDCPSAFCTQLTTIAIGTNVRLLAKSEKPETLNGVTSRWYKIQMGPEIGWIWGGLIAQKTLTSNLNSEVKFLIGEAGFDASSNQQYQIRAVKDGVELDRLVVKNNAMDYSEIELQDMKGSQDVIKLVTETSETFSIENGTSYVIWNGYKLQQQSALTASLDPVKQHPSVFCID